VLDFEDVLVSCKTRHMFDDIYVSRMHYNKAFNFKYKIPNYPLNITFFPLNVVLPLALHLFLRVLRFVPG
jgi:hypothetical protein